MALWRVALPLLLLLLRGGAGGGHPPAAPDKAAAAVNIFVVPHSHCDPGWVQTFEDYYRGPVRTILAGVLTALWADPAKRFVWSETSYFKRFFEEHRSLPFPGNQSLTFAAAVAALVAQGRLEFVGGGWVQHDEAGVTVPGALRQLRVGHDYLLREFGVRPRVGWQIDSFGLSSLSPTLFRELGFDCLVINRIPYRTKAAWDANMQREFLWHGDPYSGYPSTGMFTHVLADHYNTPRFLNWERGAEPVREDNVEFVATQLVEDALTRRQGVRHRNVVYLWGDDFSFKAGAAAMWANLQSVADYINAHTAVLQATVTVATFSEYLEAVVAALDRTPTREPEPLPTNPSSSGPGAPSSSSSQGPPSPPSVSGLPRSGTSVALAPVLPTYTGDFLPYEEGFFNYWTGFYSSRPWIKQLTRQGEAAVRAAELLVALLPLAQGKAALGRSGALWALLARAQEAVALAQHHDTVTGTSRAGPMEDARRRLQAAIQNSSAVASIVMAELLLGPPTPNRSFAFAPYGRPSHQPLQFHPTLGPSHAITIPAHHARVYIPLLVFNPLTTPRSGEPVELLLGAAKGDPCAFAVAVFTQRGHPATLQTQCTAEAALCGAVESTSPAPLGCSASNRSLVRVLFPVSLEGLATGLYFVVVTVPPPGTPAVAPPPSAAAAGDGGDIVLDNDCLQVTFAADGTLRGIRAKASRRDFSLSDQYLEYYSDPWDGHGSGAYVIRTSIYPRMLIGLGIGAVLGGSLGSYVHWRYRHRLQLRWKAAALRLPLTRPRHRRWLYSAVDAHFQPGLWPGPATAVVWLVLGLLIGAGFVAGFLTLLPGAVRHSCNVHGKLVMAPSMTLVFLAVGHLTGAVRLLLFAAACAASGVWAYVYLPGLQARPVDLAEHFAGWAPPWPQPMRVVRGDVAAELVRYVSPLVSHKFVLTHGQSCHLDMHVRMRSRRDHQLVLRFTSEDPELAGNRPFLTDNGHGTIWRQFAAERLMGGNYFPVVTTLAWMAPVGGEPRKHIQMAFLVPQAVGAAVVPPGRVEFMLHRMLSAEDEKGMEEPLLDEVPGTFSVRIVPSLEPGRAPTPAPGHPFEPLAPALRRRSLEQHHPPLLAAARPVPWPEGSVADVADHFWAAAAAAGPPATAAPPERPTPLPLFLPRFVHVVALHPYVPHAAGPVPPGPPDHYSVGLTLQNVERPGALSPDHITLAWGRVFAVPPVGAKEVTHTLLHVIADVPDHFCLPAQAIKTFIVTFQLRDQ